MRLATGVRGAAAAAALQLVLCAPAAGQQAAPSPSPSPDTEPQLVAPVPMPPPDRSPRRVAVPGAPARERDSAGAARLKDWRAVSLTEGEGQLLVDGGPRKLKAGDAIAGYVVKAIGPGRVVLEDADGLAIVTFAPGGAARVRVVLTADPTRQKSGGATSR